MRNLTGRMWSAADMRRRWGRFQRRRRGAWRLLSAGRQRGNDAPDCQPSREHCQPQGGATDAAGHNPISYRERHDHISRNKSGGSQVRRQRCANMLAVSAQRRDASCALGKLPCCMRCARIARVADPPNLSGLRRSKKFACLRSGRSVGRAHRLPCRSSIRPAGVRAAWLRPWCNWAHKRGCGNQRL